MIAAFTAGCDTLDKTNTNLASKAITGKFEQAGVPQEKTGDVIRNAQAKQFLTFKFAFAKDSVTITGTRDNFPPIEAPVLIRENVPDETMWTTIQEMQATGRHLFQFEFAESPAKGHKTVATITASFGNL